MTLPTPVQSLWEELQAARQEILREVEGLTQAQADWRPSERVFEPLPPSPPGPAEAPPVVRPEKGHSIGQLLDDIKATRERSRQSIEKLGTLDPRPLTWTHFRLGELDLAQWWMLQAHHDRDHLQQLRAVKATPGFPKA